jgi:hypothetical protein
MTDRPHVSGVDALADRRAWPELAERLGAWLPAARWFQGKARTIEVVAVDDVAMLPGDPPVADAFLTVTYRRGAPERYQIPLTAGDGLGVVAGTALADALAHPAGARTVGRLVLSGTAAGTVGGEPVREPLYLVCTNARHDPCCAEYGLPVARALRQAVGLRAWECSHIGGDRFAANLVCLPEGVYYGRVGPLDGPRVAAAHLDGRVELDHYRGRSCHSFVVQAAEYFARRELGLLGVHDLVAERHDRLDDGVHRVEFAARDRRPVVAEVVVTADPDARRLTCQALRAGRPPRYALARLEAGTPAEGR